MNPVALGCLFFGYVLVYSAMANHGRFALSPWASVIGDAYGETGGVRKKGGEVSFGEGDGFLDDVELV